jgi:uncharacterized protein with von Willebrand factor type A (vWA) domain
LNTTSKAAPAAHEAGADPLRAIAGFAALLRDDGLKIGVAEQQAMVQAALALPLTKVRQISPAWRAISCHTPREWHRWSDLFDRYWYPNRAKGTVRSSAMTRPGRDLRQVVQSLQEQLATSSPAARPSAGDSLLTARDATAASDEAQTRAQGGVSQTDPLHDRSASQWLPQDLSQLEHLAERIAQRLRRRLTRRWRTHPKGRRLDLRRTLRGSLSTGGLPLRPSWRRVLRERPRIFVLVDVSRSMQTHAQLFLRIARAFVVALNARVFVFHTRLAEVTPMLQSDSARVQEKINAVTAGFGGGTRIATSLADFHGVHARAQLTRRACVWIFSDGFDADEPRQLREQLIAIRRRGARILWFYPGESIPASQALAIARDQIESFHRLNTLRDLAEVAERLA